MGNPVSLIDPSGAEAVYVDGVKQDGYEADLWKRGASGYQSEDPDGDTKPATVDAYIMIIQKDLRKSDVRKALKHTERILARNGIPVGTIRFHISRGVRKGGIEKELGTLRYPDRSLYLGFGKDWLSSRGGSDNDYFNNHLSLDFTGLRTKAIKSQFSINWIYRLGLDTAHEFAHQLDAFALQSLYGNTAKRGARGHYDGYNLLMDGSKFPADLTGKGDHELLNSDIRARIIKYIYE
jgi:hypothetical protein